MRHIHSVLSAALLCGVLGVAGASPEAPVSTVDFSMVRVPHQTDMGSRVEVLEFFSYPCPHCNIFDPMLNAWAAPRANEVAIKRVHVAFGKKGDVHQRLYYTLEALGKGEALRGAVFKAIHADGNKLRKEQQVFDFAAAQGLDRQKFIAAYRSADVDARVAAAVAMEERYRIGQIPTVFVGGKYMTAPFYFHKTPSLYERVSNFVRGTEKRDAFEQKSTIQVINALVDKELQEGRAERSARAN
ncbi:thiol:disulfide interchange protein DsbA/DsbL [Rugamonas sp. CCM 8940]|uniref:thiol:disulfide interchange protein DsbA/DsbL n=1 Tax=Rugamonas sp. CCM 8940 TaxID=2765359 RepID=UPI0018F6EA10|nr:thiol:disulfide interchange protein DsbA/DsbL [Rugamonas sp. CCM 8940]MBJ7312555.1 thiol:disulfide interchange protein DsbA/DsbL [Rugamonas sp. CCM 8940]